MVRHRLDVRCRHSPGLKMHVPAHLEYRQLQMGQRFEMNVFVIRMIEEGLKRPTSYRCVMRTDRVRVHLSDFHESAHLEGRQLQKCSWSCVDEKHPGIIMDVLDRCEWHLAHPLVAVRGFFRP